MKLVQTIFTLYLCIRRLYPKTIYKDLRDIIMREYLRNHPGLEKFEKECFKERPYLVNRYTWLVKQEIFHGDYLILASQNGYTEIVRLLLTYERINPAALVNCAIQTASSNGHVEVVRLLLNYHNPLHPEREVNPAVWYNEPIRIVSANGYVEIVRLLLNYRNPEHPEREVNPAAENNYAIRRASYNGHVEVVRLLLEDDRVRDSVNVDESIGIADERVVKLLVTEPKKKKIKIGV